MKIILHKIKGFTFIILMLAFSGNVNAQCSITSSTSTSTLICGTLPLSSCDGNLYIGDGTTVMTLSIDSGFNLSCLGTINLVVRNNATILFGNGANERLTLEEGSTILINSGGNISGGNQCTASDRIYIGTNLVSTCNGQAGSETSFSDLESLGGTGTVTSNSPVCVGNMINLSATPPPNGSFTYSWSGPNSFTSTLQNPTLTAISTSGGQYNVIMTRVSDGKAAYGHTTVVVGSAINATLTSSDADNVFCSGTSVTFTAGGGTNYDFKVNGVSMQNGTNSAYTNTTLTNGQIVTVVVSNGSCSVTSSGIINTVNDLPSTPTVDTITQPTCAAPTGSVVLSGLPATGTWTLTRSGTSSATTTGTGTSVSISGLASGTYYYEVTNGSCTSGISTGVTINNATTKTWNGSWSPSAPTSSDSAIINADYSTSFNGDLNACSLTVNTGSTLTINAGYFVVIQNDLIVDGVLDVLDQGSLVMVNDAGVVTNNGTTNIRRFTTPFKKYDYVYWSTPVVSTTISSTFSGWKTNYAYEYNSNVANWKFASTMTPAKGYIIMVPDPTSDPLGNQKEVVFKGKVNNGVQKITGVIPDGSYLLGNPYPSALDADAFLNQNTGVLDGTLSFWTHNTSIQLASSITNGSAGSGAYAYTSDDYAYYNIVGGVGVGVGVGEGNIPSGKIASGQGFFAKSNASITGANEIVFNNSMRLGSGGTTLDNSQFFKTKDSKMKTVNAVEKHRVWLNLSNAQGAFKQTLVGYVTEATDDYDVRFDGESMNGNKYVDFYSVNQDKDLAIQGRALPFDENDEVPLGYKTSIDGSFTINVGQVDGVLANQAVFLEDKLTHTEFDLKSGNYTFSTVKGTFNDRFVLKYKSSENTLGTNDVDVQANHVLVSVANKQIKINSFAQSIDKVTVYDLSGKLVYQRNKINSNELSIADLVSSHQTLVVKTSLQNGITVTDKIIY